LEKLVMVAVCSFEVIINLTRSCPENCHVLKWLNWLLGLR